MDKIARIRQEIERRKSLLTQHSKLTYDLILETFIKEYDSLLPFLDTISEEPDKEDLNDEIKKFIEECGYERGGDKLLIAIVARHFAEWQKQQMLKEAVEGYVAQRVNGKLYAKAPVLDEMGLDFGDKVRIVVLKEEE